MQSARDAVVHGMSSTNSDLTVRGISGQKGKKKEKVFI